MKAKFRRASGNNLQLPNGWFAISHRYLQAKADRRKSHGKWYKIQSAQGHIYRILRFAPNLKGAPEKDGEIVLDWIGWLELQQRSEDTREEMDLSISQVKWWAYPKMAAAHPDPTIRLAGELGLLSVLLGFISLIIAVLAI